MATQVQAEYEPKYLTRWEYPSGVDSCYGGPDYSAFYVAPISKNRDTKDLITLSNWDTISAELDKASTKRKTGEYTFGHWGCGHFSLYLIHEADYKALEVADEWASALEDSPVANDEDLAEKRNEAEQENWDNWGAAEWRGIVQTALDKYAPEEENYWWAEEILDETPDIDCKLVHLLDMCSLTHPKCEWNGDELIYYFDKAKENITIDKLRNLTGLPLLEASQEWRREPYPWPGASPEPLEPALPTSEDFSYS